MVRSKDLVVGFLLGLLVGFILLMFGVSSTVLISASVAVYIAATEYFLFKQHKYIKYLTRR